MSAGNYAIYGSIAVAAVVLGLTVGWLAWSEQAHSSSGTGQNGDNNSILGTELVNSTQTLKKFSSLSELRVYLQQAKQNQQMQFLYDSDIFQVQPSLRLPSDAVLEAAPAPTLDVTGSEFFSGTNVQVEGVDEPDFVKTDGRYVYILARNTLTVIEAYPPQNATVVTKVGLDLQDQFFHNMFLNGDRLLIFYQGYEERVSIPEYDFIPRPISSPRTHALVIDVTDKENPKIWKDYSVDGYYTNARMLGDHVFFIVSSHVDYTRPVIPVVMESSKTVATPEVFYFDNPEDNFTFNTIASLDIFEDEVNAETFMIGSGSTIYVSHENIYITYTKNLPAAYYGTHAKDIFLQVVLPLLPVDAQQEIRRIENSELDSASKWVRISDILQETYNRMSEDDRENLINQMEKAVEDYERRIIQDLQRTVIHKIGMDRLDLQYLAKGEVPGRLLNQFSMDEFKGKFRVATTSESYSREGRIVYNNVYVLDGDLDTIGKLEGLAPNETIYSARFMGDKLYLVTFERIDPFFVIDISGDTPRVLGELKIPGFSSYLHPYDENHIIGIGRETKENNWGGIEPIGVKIALFDVSNVSEPKTVDVFIIGDRSAYSEVLDDHKALLFDREKDILSIPVQTNLCNDGLAEDVCFKYAFWVGFYVFGIDLEQGFDMKATIEHSDSLYGDGYGSSRSFYIGNALYTVSSGLMKITDLATLDELNRVELVNTGEIIKYLD